MIHHFQHFCKCFFCIVYLCIEAHIDGRSWIYPYVKSLATTLLGTSVLDQERPTCLPASPPKLAIPWLAMALVASNIPNIDTDDLILPIHGNDKENEAPNSKAGKKSPKNIAVKGN